MATETSNTRQFQVSPHIIYSLIKAQAGTLAKGLLECVMNSVDAGAKHIDIVLNSKTLLVTDDGTGFQTRADIEACFEVFGFEHKEGDRTYGQFGIGRAQLWNFCSTVWHTNSFRMDVDIKNKGLDYNLVENVGPVKGLRIEGLFYEPLPTSDVLSCEREIKELATYVDIPVTFNGERISKDPKAQKWAHETDDAWIQLSPSSRTLTVYNLGVKVREYPAYQFGSGGLVVTKPASGGRPAVRLSLNMARNDILLTECKVWKRIRPFLQAKTDEAVKRSTRLSEEQLANLATRSLSEEVKYEDVSARKLIVDILGGNHTLEEFFTRAWRTSDKTVTMAVKTDAGATTDQAHKNGYCFVLDNKTLTRFGVRTLTELMKKLEAVLTSQGEQALVVHYVGGDYQSKGKPKRLKVVEEWREACKKVSEAHTEIPHKEWTKREQAAMSAIRGLSSYFVRLLGCAGVQHDEVAEREIRLGVSDSAEAWTDGKALIWINRETLARMDQGLSGVMHVAGIMVHEYLHGEPSTGTHVHDTEFHERFHQAMLFYPEKGGWGTTIGSIVAAILRNYMKESSKRGVHIKSRVVQGTDNAEAFAVMA